MKPGSLREWTRRRLMKRRGWVWRGGDFEDSEEEGAAVVEEFYVQEDEAIDQVSMPSKPSLAEKLHQKAGGIRSPAGQGDSV